MTPASASAGAGLGNSVLLSEPVLKTGCAENRHQKQFQDKRMEAKPPNSVKCYYGGEARLDPCSQTLWKR